MAQPLTGLPAPAKHRGFLGTVGHLIGQTAKDFENAAIGSAGAAIRAGEYTLSHNLTDTAAQLPKVGEAVAQGVYQDFQHPLRHPGYTLLDVLGLTGNVGGIVGRVGEAGRVLEGTSKLAELGTGEMTTAQQLRHAILHGNPPEDRFISSGETKIRNGYFSKNPTIKAAQKLLDRAHEANPTLHIPGLFKGQEERLAKAVRVENTLQPLSRNMARDLPAKLVAKYKGLTNAEFVAGRIVAEGISPDDRIAYHERQLAAGLPERQGRETRQQIKLIQEAKPLLTTREFVNPEDGTVHQLPAVNQAANKKLAEFVDDARHLSNTKDSALSLAGVLSNHARVNRLLGPYNEISGRGIPENLPTLRKQLISQQNLDMHSGRTEPSSRTFELEGKIARAEGQLKMEDNAAAEHVPLHDESLANEMFYMPYKLERSSKTLVGGRSAYKGGKPAEPSRLTHAFKAEILKGGTGRVDLAHVLAENYIESERFLHFKDMYDRLQKAAVDDPSLIPEEYRQAILAPGNKQWPKDLKFAQGLVGKEPAEIVADPKLRDAAARWYDNVRRFFFDPTAEDQKIYGVKYIDKRLLGGLNEQNPLLTAFENGTWRRAVRFTDSVNSAQKSALLYLKPAYLIPNMLGNVALNLVQQGFLFPGNLAKSTILLKRLDPDVRATIKTAMGGGLTHILEADRSLPGRISQGGNWLADKYGKIIDDPFRFSSFLHEARLEGFKTPLQLKALTQSEQYADKLVSVAKRANDEIIDYERLGPNEQAILRRLVFFYPWVKGSSRYAVQLVTNHPTAAGLIGQEGKQETEFAHSILGEVPSYAEGLVPHGNPVNGVATVQNPSAFSILETPAQLLQQVGNLFGKPNVDLSAAQNLTPADSALLDLLTSGAANPFHKTGQSALSTAANDLYGGNPVKTLIDNLTKQKPPGSLYGQDSTLGAISRFAAFGGLTNRPYNVSKGQFIAYLQKHPHP